ncbi:helix-turn-helix protein [Marinifilum flexuosum]|uniref:Helix-turn-helix protein n=2 Tax=Marinifilum flexuosum TaxID=1117708 RepID=A0A419X3R0_9BACT|nr:helix-turn-helix protein [Marinifilum flexuosum]
MGKATQTQQIKQYLESGGTLTALSALEKFGCMRLAARINDLRKDKLPIASRTITKGDKRFAEYYINTL